jgi:hypothetical protein
MSTADPAGTMNAYDLAVKRMENAQKRLDEAEIELDDANSEYENAEANLAAHESKLGIPLPQYRGAPANADGSDHEHPLPADR